MNPRPVCTGTQIMHFSRTFRHYIKTGDPKYEGVFNQQWSDIPYQHCNYALKPRDWQLINIASKRWRVLSCGFNMTHIIPFENGGKTEGGAVKPDIAFNLLPYLETYIDKGYQLPTFQMYTNGDGMPNARGAQNSGNQTTAALHQLIYNTANPFLYSTDNSQQVNYNKYAAKAPIMDLMNSSEWGTLQPTQEFSFEWTPSVNDLKWRHAMTPDCILPANPASALALGRWDGGNEISGQTTLSSANINIKNGIRENCEKPAPTCIVRPVTFHDNQGNLIPLVFQCLIKYHVTLELDMNDIGFRPLFTSAYGTSTSTDNPEMVFDIFNAAKGYSKPSRNTWCGANAAGGKFFTGPSNQGYTT